MDSSQSEDSCSMDTSQPGDYEERPFKCPLCGNRFNRSGHLKIHLAVHTGERPYVCDVCGDKFKQSSALKTHKLRHTGDRPYMCKVCNKSFRTSSTLKKHSFVHTGEKPFKCDICGKSFNQSGALKSHSFTHRPETERPFQCNLCNQGFVNKSIFRIHSLNCGGERKKYSHNPPLDERLFIESGLNKFDCSFCKKTFADKTRLRIHLRTHTGERPYKCELCGRAFSQSGDLKIHFYTHTGERPHKCTMCDKGYTNKGTLNQHMRTHEKSLKAEKKSMKTQLKYITKETNKRTSTPRVKLGAKLMANGEKNLNEDSNVNSHNALSAVSDSEPDKDDVSSDSNMEYSEESGTETQVDDECPEFETKYIVAPEFEENKNTTLSLRPETIQKDSDSRLEIYHDVNLEPKTEPTENALESASEMIHNNNSEQGPLKTETDSMVACETKHDSELEHGTERTSNQLDSTSQINNVNNSGHYIKSLV